MPPAAPHTCEYPGCQHGTPDGDGNRLPYVTHVECATKPEVMEDYKTHVEVVYNLPLRSQELPVKQMEAETNKILAENAVRETTGSTDARPNKAKIESIPRPKISSNAN